MGPAYNPRVASDDLQAGPIDAFDAWPLIASVELDRFCDRCGYNLRTQAVRRDPRTEVLLCRCPECGRFQAAADAATTSRAWLQRLATLALAWWIGLIGSLALGIALGQGGITVFTLDALTTYRRVPMPLPGNPQAFQYILQRQSCSEWKVLYAFSGGISLLLGFVAGAGLVVALHHWRRWGYAATAIGVPVLVAAVVALIWWGHAPHLLRWAFWYMAAHTLLCMLGGLVGTGTGRPLARLIVRTCLPPRLRPVLAFLWLVDGKAPPSAK